MTDMILDEMADFDGTINGCVFHCCVGPQTLTHVTPSMCYRDPSGLEAFCQKELPQRLAFFAQHLDNVGGAFMAGISPSVADFKVYETLDKLRILEGELGTNTLKSNKVLVAYGAYAPCCCV
jgi:hypothetical protein